MSTLTRSLRIGRELARIGSAIVAERVETGYVFNPLLNPLLRQAREWPYPLYQRLRERDPIHRSRAIRGWFLFRHADCLAVLRDGRFSADDRNYAGYAQQRAWEIADGLADPNQPDEPPMLRRDPPDHTRLRKLVSKAFTPRALEQLRPRVEELADRLLTPLARRGEFDVIRDFAIPFPVTIIAEMLGIPTCDFATFKRWSTHLVGFLDPLASPGPKVLRKTVDEFDAYMSRLAEERRQEPAEDLLSALVQTDEQGQRLSAQELQGTLALLRAAGNETTTNLIGNGLVALLLTPISWRGSATTPVSPSARSGSCCAAAAPIIGPSGAGDVGRRDGRAARGRCRPRRRTGSGIGRRADRGPAAGCPARTLRSPGQPHTGAGFWPASEWHHRPG